MALAARWNGAPLWNVSAGSPWRAGSSRSFDWSGAEGLVLLATPGHGEDSRAGHEGQAHAVCVLWRRKTHLHHLLCDADIPTEVGGMMRPRTSTQHRGVMGIIFCQPLAPFFDPTHRAPCRLGQFPWRGLRGLLQQIAEQGSIAHPCFFHGVFLLTKSNPPPFLLHCISSVGVS